VAARALVFAPPSVTEGVCDRGTCGPARVERDTSVVDLKFLPS
jgi:hypothetical protein